MGIVQEKNRWIEKNFDETEPIKILYILGHQFGGGDMLRKKYIEELTLKLMKARMVS